MPTPDPTDVVDLATDIVATARLVKLVKDDRIVQPLRTRALDVGARHDVEETVGYFLSCPWCLGIWLAAGVTVARFVAPRQWRWVSRALATAAIASELVERV